ncbi:MAG: helix-turn-helix domain-containing protein [Brevundimonas sp.]|nr:helix-turn-helix domain-containing protein [Brevundimonas sp.]
MTEGVNDNRVSADARIVLTNKEAARKLGVSHRTLEDWRLTNRGPRFVKLGRLVRYRLSDLHDFMDRNSFMSTAQAVAA